MNRTIIVILLVIGALGVISLATRSAVQLEQTTTEQAPTLPAPQDALLQGGSSFTDPNTIYTFLFPNAYKLDTSDPIHTRITKIGATQRGQTEIYDGVIVVFEAVALENQTLEEFVDTRIGQALNDGTSELTQPKQPTTLNSYPGFIYTIRGLGESSYLAIQKNAQSPNAVIITYLISDPENGGYQQDVEAILATMQLHK